MNTEGQRQTELWLLHRNNYYPWNSVKNTNVVGDVYQPWSCWVFHHRFVLHAGILCLKKQQLFLSPFMWSNRVYMDSAGFCPALNFPENVQEVNQGKACEKDLSGTAGFFPACLSGMGIFTFCSQLCPPPPTTPRPRRCYSFYKVEQEGKSLAGERSSLTSCIMCLGVFFRSILGKRQSCV